MTVCVACVALFVVVFGALQCCDSRGKKVGKRKPMYRELISTSESEDEDVKFSLRGNGDYVSLSMTRSNGSVNTADTRQLIASKPDHE